MIEEHWTDKTTTCTEWEDHTQAKDIATWEM